MRSLCAAARIEAAERGNTAGMSIEHSIDKGVKNIKDSVTEGMHRSAAEGEQAKRDVAGDRMTPGETVKSVANQAKQTVQAEYDATKRDVRKNT